MLNRKSVHTLVTLALLSCPFLIGSRAEADMIPVVNAGFEAQILGNGNSNPVLTGWKGDGGAFNPSAADFLDEAPEGVNIAYLNGGVIFQVLSSELVPGVYTLAVDMGRRLGHPFPGYSIQLLAGSVVIAEDVNSLLPATGTFLTTTVNYTATASDSNLGQALTIRLTSVGVQVNFDDVRLKFTPSAVPEPASLVMLGTGTLSLLGYGWRRRKVATAS